MYKSSDLLLESGILYCTNMCRSAVDWLRCNLVQDACIACAACGLMFMQHLRLLLLQAAPKCMCVVPSALS
jgi:hypothetical protein